jgi:hypothetical protein
MMNSRENSRWNSNAPKELDAPPFYEHPHVQCDLFRVKYRFLDAFKKT